MPKFSYTVINKQNQELNGTINAPNIKNARNELNQLGLSVISIEEVYEENTTTPAEESFEFEAFDTTGRKILGRIKESNKDSAYQRLRTEYNFDVIAIYPSELSPSEKEQAKQDGVKDLAENFQPTSPNPLDSEGIPDSLEEKRKALEGKVETVIKKTNEFLEKFSDEIKPNEKKEIIEKMDKIKLIKSSTNLQHIQELCEELLTEIQKKDIFLHKEQMIQEKTSVAIEAKKMISDLHKKPATKSSSQTPNSLENNALTDTVSNLFHKIFAENPEAASIKEKIRAKTVNIIEYAKLYFQANTPEEKEELKSRMKALYQERKEFKKQLQEIRNKNHASFSQKLAEGELKNIDSQLKSFTGWILFFYLVYYFTGTYITSKQILFTNPPTELAIQDTSIFKYLLSIIFLIHVFLGIKIYYAAKNSTFNIIGIPLVFLASILIIFNF